MPTRRRDIALRLNAAKTGASQLFETLPYLKSLLISPTAAHMAGSLAKNWRIYLADLDTKPCQINPDSAAIFINSRGLNPLSIMRSRYFRKSAALNTLYALREAWQTTRPHDLYDHHTPALWPHIARILAADAAIFTIQMAYETMQNGDDESLWRYVLGEDIGDIAQIYATHHDPKDPFFAQRAAYFQWYKTPERINLTDSALLNYMDELPLNPNHRAHHQAAQKLDCDIISQTLNDPLATYKYLPPTLIMHDMPDAINRAHFARILDEMHAVRIGNFHVRDTQLARRLLTT